LLNQQPLSTPYFNFKKSLFQGIAKNICDKLFNQNIIKLNREALIISIFRIIFQIINSQQI
jgi:hypothetical protein